MSAVIGKDKGHRKEVLRKFLAKTEDLTGQVVEEKEKKTQDGPDPKMSVVKQETIKKDRKWDIEWHIAALEGSLMIGRSEIMKIDKTIAVKERRLKHLEKIFERQNCSFEEFLKRSEEKLVVSTTFFEKEGKSTQEKNAVIEKLTDEIGTIKSEFAKIEELRSKYKRYQNTLFRLSPPEWQEAQEAGALKVKVASDRNTQDEQNGEPHESAIRHCLERGLESSPGGVLPSTGEPTLSTAHSNTLITNSDLDCDGSVCEVECDVTFPLPQEKLELYFSDPQQLLGAVTELTEQYLSLIQNSTRVDETLEELRQIIETTLKNMKEDEETLTLQVNDRKDRIDKEKERAANLKKKVQLHDLLKTEDQDVLLDELGMVVTEVHRCCVDGRLTNLSTLEKLSSVEYRMYSLLQLIENIPEQSLETLRQIKDSERRSRLREAELSLEREKQKERMKKCIQRSLGDTKKMSGRKLVPRCVLPVPRKIKVSHEDDVPAEEELHAYLFTTE